MNKPMGTKASIVAGLLLTFATMAYGDEIHVAAEKGDLKKVRSLIAANPSLVNVEGHQNATPLHWAAAKGHNEIADFLISKKANLEAKDRYGFTPLLTAAQNGQKEVVELLLRHKANIEAKENTGKTSLHWAASFNHKAVVEVLLINKADVNPRDKHNETPLRKAIQQGYKDVAKVLQQYGAKQ